MKFQNGGFIPQVYNTQQVNPVFLNGDMGQMINAAGMPLESGLNGYMGLQQLDIQRGQEERAKEEFKYKIKVYDRVELDSVLKQMNTLRDDFSKIEILPQDGEKYNQILNQYVTEDVKRRAASGDINAMKEYYMGYNSFVMHPEIRGMMQRKVASDKNTEMFTKNKELSEFITNYDDIIKAYTSGSATPPPIIDYNALKSARESERNAVVKQREAQALQSEANAQKLREDAELKKQYDLQLDELAIQRSGITRKPDGNYNDEEQAAINRQKYMLKNGKDLAEQQVAAERNKIFQDELAKNPGKALEIYNKVYGNQGSSRYTIDDAMGNAANYIIKAFEDGKLTREQMISEIQNLRSTSSSVTHNSGSNNNTNSQDRPDGTTIDQAEGTIRNTKDGKLIKVIINGKEHFYNSLPSSVTFENGKLKIQGDNKDNLDWLNKSFGINATTVKAAKDILKNSSWDGDYLSVPIGNMYSETNVAADNTSGTTNNTSTTTATNSTTPQYNNPIIDLSKGTYKTSVGERKIIPYNTQTGNTNYVKKDLTLDTNVYYIKDSGAESFNANDISDKLLATLNMIAKAEPSGKALITSGKRSKAHNEDVGGKPNSHHLTGDAVDIAADPGVAEYLTKGMGASILRSQGFTAIHEGDHIHIQPSSSSSSTITGKNW